MAPDQPQLKPRTMAWTAAGLYGAVAVAGLADLLLPGEHDLSPVPVLGLTALAVLMALLGPLVSVRVLALNGLIGVACATYASASMNAGISDPAFLFTLPVVWQGLFFGRRGALTVLALASVGEVTSALLNGQGGVMGHCVGVIVSVSAITGVVVALCSRNERLLAAATHQAQVDPLTGLLNRRAFDALAQVQIAALEQTIDRYAVVAVDLDHFKAINDTHGHDVGDRVLVHVAGILVDELADRGLLARFGGEEFVGFLPGMGMAEAVALAEGLRRRIATTTPAGLPPIQASAGVAEVDADESLRHVLVRADAALYEVKRTGRNRVGVSNPAGETPSAPMVGVATAAG